MGIRFRINYYIYNTVVGPFTLLSITNDLNWLSLSVQSLGGDGCVSFVSEFLIAKNQKNPVAEPYKNRLMN